MFGRDPGRNSVISWRIIGIGAAVSLIGAYTARAYELNFLLVAGLICILAGVICHLAFVRCPVCGHSLAGYRPLPEKCPKCQTDFKDE